MASPEESRSYSFTGSQFSPLLRAGVIEIADANTLPLGEAHFRGSAEEAVLRLGYPAKRSADSAMVVFHMFQLPAREAEFQRICESYGERKKRPKFAEGIAFDASLFAARGIPTEWRHEAWAHGNCDIIHTYASAHRGMLIRWSGTKVAMLTHPLLALIHEKLQVRPDQWETKPPEIQPKPDYAPPFTAGVITPQLQEEIQGAAQRACQRLGLDLDAPPLAIVRRIANEVDTIRLDRGELASSEKEALAIDLGALWGHALCWATGWRWCCLLKDGAYTASVVCSPSASHRVNPIANLYALLKSPAKSSNSELLFNLIVAGELPAAPPASLLELS